MSPENPDNIERPEKTPQEAFKDRGEFEDQEIEAILEWVNNIKTNAKTDVGRITSYPEKAVLAFEKLKNKGNKEDFNELIDDLQRLTEKYIRLKSAGKNTRMIMGQMKFVAEQIRGLEGKDAESEVKTGKGIYGGGEEETREIWEAVKNTPEESEIREKISQAKSISELTEIFESPEIPHIQEREDKRQTVGEIHEVLVDMKKIMDTGIPSKDLVKDLYLKHLTRAVGLRDKVSELVDKEYQEIMPSDDDITEERSTWN